MNLLRFAPLPFGRLACVLLYLHLKIYHFFPRLNSVFYKKKRKISNKNGEARQKHAWKMLSLLYVFSFLFSLFRVSAAKKSAGTLSDKIKYLRIALFLFAYTLFLFYSLMLPVSRYRWCQESAVFRSCGVCCPFAISLACSK